jgi:hypothetical protein
MSGISKSFKLPTLNLAKRRKTNIYKWEDVKDLQPLCVGSFGSVSVVEVLTRHFLIPWTGGAFAPLGPSAPPLKKKNGLLPQSQGPRSRTSIE